MFITVIGLISFLCKEQTWRKSGSSDFCQADNTSKAAHVMKSVGTNTSQVSLSTKTDTKSYRNVTTQTDVKELKYASQIDKGEEMDYPDCDLEAYDDLPNKITKSINYKLFNLHVRRRV